MMAGVVCPRPAIRRCRYGRVRNPNCPCNPVCAPCSRAQRGVENRSDVYHVRPQWRRKALTHVVRGTPGKPPAGRRESHQVTIAIRGLALLTAHASRPSLLTAHSFSWSSRSLRAGRTPRPVTIDSAPEDSDHQAESDALAERRKPPLAVPLGVFAAP